MSLMSTLLTLLSSCVAAVWRAQNAEKAQRDACKYAKEDHEEQCRVVARYGAIDSQIVVFIAIVWHRLG